MIRSIITRRAYSEAVTKKFSPAYLKLQVGQIQSCKRHEGSDNLYVSQIQIDDSNTYQICSGLVPYIPIEQMQNKRVVVVTNMKQKKLRGEASKGMILAATSQSEGQTQVEVVEPPKSSIIGERLFFGSEDHDFQPPVLKTAVWEYIQPRLKTNKDKQPVFVDEEGKELVLRGKDESDSASVPTLTNASVH